jgi:hypothetical protein
VEVDRVEGEGVALGRGERAIEVLLVDAELRRLGARVQAARVPAHHAGARVDAQADGAPGTAPADALDLGHEVDVEVYVERCEDVEVPLGDVGAGVADLAGQEAAGERTHHLSGRAGVEAESRVVAGRGEAP